MSTMGGVQYNGGYHPLKFEYRDGYHDTCGGYHEYNGGVQYHGILKKQKTLPPTLHGTHVHHGIPTVLNIPHGTQDNPHGTQDITTVLNTPSLLKISPTVLMISPHSIEHFHGTVHPPRYCTHIIHCVNVSKLNVDIF